MLPLPKFLTLPAILSTLFPTASPGKPSEFPEAWAIKGFYLVAAWTMLGAPNWNKISLPAIKLPSLPADRTPLVTQTTPLVTQATAFTTPTTTRTAVTPVSGVLVSCPAMIQVVNIRQGPGLTNVLATVPCGDRVNLLGKERIPAGNETWLPVEYKGTKGWVTTRYLKN